MDFLNNLNTFMYLLDKIVLCIISAELFVNKPFFNICLK